VRGICIIACAAGLAVSLTASSAWSQAAEGTAFTYQGQLKEGGVPANGFYDFLFRLYDFPEDGGPIPIGVTPDLLLFYQEVKSGLFTVELDFGADVFQEHDALWLEVGVKPASDVGFGFTILSPRHRIDSTPRAIVAKYAESTKGGLLSFGDTARTSIGINPGLPGLTAMDPVGMRVMTMTHAAQCSISGEPCMLDQHCPLDETCDPCETCAPLPTREGSLYFGQRSSSIGIRENLSGLIISDVGGLRLVAGAHICSEEYLTYPKVKYCEADSDCYGCCTPMKHCSISGTFCETTEDCQTGHCTYSGNDCNTAWDCAPGRCSYSLSPCYFENCNGPAGDSCSNPSPEGCVGGETCEEDRACYTHCQSDEDCPDEGSFCDSPVSSDCISPEGRCSGNNWACYADTDCPAGHCTGSPEWECWADSDCFVCGWGCYDWGPCVGPERCIQPIPGRLGNTLALHFGESDDHAFGFDPGLQRLVAVDPGGLSLVSPGDTCSGSGESCDSDEDCPVGGCSDNGYACRTDADCFGATAGTCTNPPPQTCESDINGLKVFFGSDGGTSIGTEPALGGLVLRSPDGARLVASSPLGGAPASAKLFFGDSAASPYIGEDPVAGGLVLGSPRCRIVFDPQPKPPGKLRLAFGLTNDTSIGTDPDAAGLILSDPTGVRLLNSMNPTENALIFGMATARGVAREPRIDTGIASDQMRFSASGFFFEGGPVGIGTATPRAIFEVEGGAPVGVLGTVAAFDRTLSDGIILDFQRDGSSVGGISVSRGIVSYNSFTGSHLGRSDEKFDRGALIRLTGVNTHLRDDPESEIVYGIARSTRANDPSCLGAYFAERQVGESDNRRDTHLIMAEGNGEMWVVDTGNDIQPGDYLISSDVSGCAMKDDPLRFPVGHIVARAAEGANWGGIKPNENGVRKAKISVFFESFVRGSDASRLTAEVARLKEVAESQRRTIEVLEKSLGSLQGIVERLSRLEEAQTSTAGSADSDRGGAR